MRKIKEFLKKYSLTIIISLVAIILSIGGVVIYKLFIYNKIEIKEFSNSLYKVKYDTTWKLNEQEQSLIFEHKKGATIKIEYITLTNDFLYTSLENIVDEISYSIIQENPNYYLIGKEPIYVTNNKYEGYQLLYENGENEVLLTLFKKEDKIVSIVYEANYEYFDILLDSVKEIIYNFDLVTKEYELSYKVSELELKELSISGNKSVKTSETETWEVADSHYLVEYTVPANFEILNYDNRYNTFKFTDDSKGHIEIDVFVKDENIYQILEDLKNYDYDYSIGKAHEENTLQVETYTQKDDWYIYHAEYKEGEYNTEYDAIYMIYSLDKRKTFVVYIEGYNKKLDESIVENIDIIKKIKYADFVYRNIENGYLVNELKYIYDRYDKKYYLMKLYTPEEYSEYDDGYSNVYESRKFRKKYDEELMEYLFNVRYRFTKFEIDYRLSSVEYLYSLDSKSRKSLGTKKYNDKDFDVYYYEFNNRIGKVYCYVLYYEISDGNFLEIVIESIDSKVGNNDVISLTKFDIESQVMK